MTTAAAIARPAVPSAQDTLSTELKLAADTPRTDGRKPRPAGEKQLAAVLEKRLPILVAMGGKVEVRSPEDIRVRAPAPNLTPSQTRLFARVGRLELRHLEDVRSNLNPDARYYVEFLTVAGGRSETSSIRFRDRRRDTALAPEEFLRKCPLLLDNQHLLPDGARRVGSGALIGVRVQLNKNGSRRLDRFAERPGKILAIALDGELISMTAATARARSGRKDEKDEVRDVDILGGFATPEEAAYLAIVLNSGPLPYPLKLVESKVIAE